METKYKDVFEIKLEYQLHMLLVLIVFVLLNHQPLIVTVAVHPVDELFRPEWMI